MANIGKLNFPSITQATSLSEFRLDLQNMATWLNATSAAGVAQFNAKKAVLLTQIQALLTYMGVANVPNGFVLTGVAPTGTYASTVTFTVSPTTGLITAIVLA